MAKNIEPFIMYYHTTKKKIKIHVTRLSCKSKTVQRFINQKSKFTRVDVLAENYFNTHTSHIRDLSRCQNRFVQPLDTTAIHIHDIVNRTLRFDHARLFFYGLLKTHPRTSNFVRLLLLQRV